MLTLRNTTYVDVIKITLFYCIINIFRNISNIWVHTSTYEQHYESKALCFRFYNYKGVIQCLRNKSIFERNEQMKSFSNFVPQIVLTGIPLPILPTCIGRTRTNATTK